MSTSTTVASSPQKLDKERVPELQFSGDDVLKKKEEVSMRRIDLQRAQALGAQSKSNIKIYISDAQDNRYVVEATVWAATEKNVTLKGGIIIPIRAIYKVGFF